MVGTKPETVKTVLYQLLYLISFLNPSKLSPVLLSQALLSLHGMQGVRSSSLLGSTEFHQVVRSDPCRTWRKVDSITEFCTTCCVAIVQKRLLQNRAAAHATDIRSRPPHKQDDAQQWPSTYEQWPDGLPTFSDVVSSFKSCGSTQAYFANVT